LTVGDPSVFSALVVSSASIPAASPGIATVPEPAALGLPAAGVSPVPEPGTLALAAAGLIAGLCLRHRKARWFRADQKASATARGLTSAR
jgi:hypothetical protein